ncbi:HlyD family secretion protein [Planctomycetes bacterium Pan216]|uniref:HlyD family secretion protein n=1 Tax=Kolteria novifilia TaxID=2527975 RepID=A0A518BAN1_9BACT|nr:HlyD family secretion protein [Planctomycetes bacterium Pan216]
MARPTSSSSKLDRVASPEQLDRLVSLTTPASWLMLASFGLVTIAVCIWAVLGQIPTRVSGSGIFFRNRELVAVVAPGSGLLTEVHVTAGDKIKADDTLGTIQQFEIEDELFEARENLAQLVGADRKFKALADAAIELQARYTRTRQMGLEENLNRSDRILDQFNIRLQRQTVLKARDLISTERLLQTEQVMDETVRLINDARSELRELPYSLEMLKHQKQEAELTRQMEIEAIGRQIKILENRLERRSQTKAPTDGHVVEVRAESGREVELGEVLMLVQPKAEERALLHVTLYVDARRGKEIEAGMSAEVAPTMVAPEEFGYLTGEVIWVAEYPASPGNMAVRLKNEQLVQEYTDRTPFPLAVRIKLHRDERTKSNYRWTSSRGPDIVLTEGTICNGHITTRTQPPISLLIPFLNRWTGLE